MRKINISHLPSEIIKNILDFLSLESLEQLKMTNKKFLEAVNEYISHRRKIHSVTTMTEIQNAIKQLNNVFTNINEKKYTFYQREFTCRYLTLNKETIIKGMKKDIKNLEIFNDIIAKINNEVTFLAFPGIPIRNILLSFSNRYEMVLFINNTVYSLMRKIYIFTKFSAIWKFWLNKFDENYLEINSFKEAVNLFNNDRGERIILFDLKLLSNKSKRRGKFINYLRRMEMFRIYIDGKFSFYGNEFGVKKIFLGLDSDIPRFKVSRFLTFAVFHLYSSYKSFWKKYDDLEKTIEKLKDQCKYDETILLIKNSKSESDILKLKLNSLSLNHHICIIDIHDKKKKFEIFKIKCQNVIILFRPNCDESKILTKILRLMVRPVYVYKNY
jgi:hypothetical protein